MAYLTKQQVAEIISKAPQGTTPEGIVSALRLQGNQLEGFDSAPKEKTVSKDENKVGQFAEGVAKKTVGTFARLGESVAENTLGRLIPKKEGSMPTNVLTDALNAPATSGAEKAGEVAGDIFSLAIPGGAVTKATKGAGLLTKIGARAGTSGAIVSAQEGEVGAGTAVAVGTEALLPGVGKLLKPIGRLIKSLASGLSGAPAKAIEAIVAEPSVAKQVAKEVDLSGSTGIIKKNAETIINGVSKIRQDARKAYGLAISELKTTDIKPGVFRKSVSETLDKYGSVIKNGERKLTNVEFENPAMLKKANTLINKLSKTNLDGLSLNRLQNEIESSAFKTTGGDAQRLSFNAFIKDLAGSVRSSINKSTDKLKEINKAYSTDLQLTEAVEDIMGGVEFKNLAEINKVSKKLESLFSQKGLSPVIVDDFLTKIGVKPSEFRASEAVKQVANIEDKANQMGLNFSEMLRGLTSSMITPETVRDVAILTGVAEQSLLPVLQKLAPTARASLIRLLTEGVSQ